MDFMKVKIPFVPWILWVRVFSTEVIDVDSLVRLTSLTTSCSKTRDCLPGYFCCQVAMPGEIHTASE